LLGIAYFRKQLADSLIIFHFCHLIIITKDLRVIAKNVPYLPKKVNEADIAEPAGADTVPKSIKSAGICAKKSKNSKIFYLLSSQQLTAP